MKAHYSVKDSFLDSGLLSDYYFFHLLLIHFVKNCQQSQKPLFESDKLSAK